MSLIKLKSQHHIDTLKIMSITPNGDKYDLKMNSGKIFDVTAEEFPWLVKICGFLIETKSKAVINIQAISSTEVNNDGALVTLDNGDSFQVSAAENFGLAGECECMDLKARIVQLQSYGEQPHDYKKL